MEDEKVQELGGEVVEAFRQRCEKGFQKNEMWNKSVEELAHAISDNNAPVANQAFKRRKLEMDGEEGRYPTTILKDPLPRNEITALEERLDIVLPNDYKDFLATTSGIDNPEDSMIFGAPIFPALKVRWITEDEDYFTDLAADILPDIYRLIVEVVDDDDWPKVGMPLQIGSEDIDEVWLLPPANVKKLVAFHLGQRDRSTEKKGLIENAVALWAGSVLRELKVVSHDLGQRWKCYYEDIYKFQGIFGQHSREFRY